MEIVVVCFRQFSGLDARRRVSRGRYRHVSLLREIRKLARDGVASVLAQEVIRINVELWDLGDSVRAFFFTVYYLIDSASADTFSAPLDASHLVDLHKLLYWLHKVSSAVYVHQVHC